MAAEGETVGFWRKLSVKFGLVPTTPMIDSFPISIPPIIEFVFIFFGFYLTRLGLVSTLLALYSRDHMLCCVCDCL